MSARTKAVQVIARSMVLSTIGDLLPADTPWEVLHAHALANDGAEIIAQVLVEAEAAVTALETEMGMTEEINTPTWRRDDGPLIERRRLITNWQETDHA